VIISAYVFYSEFKYPVFTSGLFIASPSFTIFIPQAKGIAY